jgi:hypothetical protein
MNNIPNLSQPLCILLWNTNGLIKHKNELQISLEEKNLSIALITETHLTNNKIFSVPGYTTYVTNHPDGTAHAGTAILIKSNITHSILPQHQSDCLQSTNISIIMNHIPVTIASVYPQPIKKLTYQEFSTLIESFTNTYIMGGDFNAKHPLWGSITTNNRGRTLHKIIIDKKIKWISPLSPTYWPTDPNKNPDLLDFFITNLPNHIQTHIQNSNILSSDHSPILLTINSKLISLKKITTLTPGPTNWNEFQHTLKTKINLSISLKSSIEIDNAIDSFTTLIQKAALDSSPEPSTTKPDKINLPHHIQQLLSEKIQARNRWQRTRMPSDKKTLNHLSNSLKNILKKYNSDKYQSYIESLSNNKNSIWKSTKKILSHRQIMPPLRNSDNSLAITNNDKANLISTYLEDNFKPHNDINDNEHYLTIENIVNQPLSAFSPFQPKHNSIRDNLYY